EEELLYKVIFRKGPGCGPETPMGTAGRKQRAECPLGSLGCHAPPSQPGGVSLTWPRPPERKARPGGLRCRPGTGSGLSCCGCAHQAMPRRPGGYFLSSRGAGSGSGRALGEGSGSQSRNSWSSVLTVSGHSSITMWLPSSMSFRNAKSRICRRRGAQDRRGQEGGARGQASLGHRQPHVAQGIQASLFPSILAPSTSTRRRTGEWPVALREPN
ncbi:hypothetical protein P7K49_033556, partial [Saguinus oedipus]